MGRNEIIRKIEEKIELLGFLKCESEDLMKLALEFGSTNCDEYKSSRMLRNDIIKRLAYLEKKLFQFRKSGRYLEMPKLELNLNFQFAI